MEKTMISRTTLEELQDDELAGAKSVIDDILRKRDEQRKAEAIENARAVKAKALSDARAVLAAAGLTLKALGKNGKKKAGRGIVYRSGHTYRHPANASLVWNAKGKKPIWLVELEASGGTPMEVASLSADDGKEAKRAG
jgi:DNA-binding protein H-NS